MADQVTFGQNSATPPDGTIVSTDDAGAAGHVQRVKLAFSADGVATHATVDADGVLVNLGANNDVAVTGTVTANAGTNLNTSTLALEAGGNLAAAATSLSLLDNTVAGSELQVDVLTMPSVAVTQSGTWDEVGIHDSGNSITVDGTVAVSGTVTVNGSGVTQPVSHAALTELAAAIDTEMQVDVVAALPAGTNNIGDVDIASIAAGDNNIGNVDVVSMPVVAVSQSGTWDEVGINDSGNSITVDYATTGSGTATGALRVELPTNGTGVIATVGAVTAITNALPTGSNAIGKLAANSGVDIGDVDITSQALPTPAASATVTSQTDQATNATLLSSSATRKGFRIYNDSTVNLYVKYGTTATSTDFTVLMLPGAYLEENFYYGRVDGIWASDASGSARITELT